MIKILKNLLRLLTALTKGSELIKMSTHLNLDALLKMKNTFIKLLTKECYLQAQFPEGSHSGGESCPL